MKLADKVVNDLESRSRRNNPRIFGVPEGTEGSSPLQFVEKLFRNELTIPEDMDLQIQRAHRALAQKPDPNSPPRSKAIQELQKRGYNIEEPRRVDDGFSLIEQLRQTMPWQQVGRRGNTDTVRRVRERQSVP